MFYQKFGIQIRVPHKLQSDYKSNAQYLSRKETQHRHGKAIGMPDIKHPSTPIVPVSNELHTIMENTPKADLLTVAIEADAVQNDAVSIEDEAPNATNIKLEKEMKINNPKKPKAMSKKSKSKVKVEELDLAMPSDTQPDAISKDIPIAVLPAVEDHIVSITSPASGNYANDTGGMTHQNVSLEATHEQNSLVNPSIAESSELPEIVQTSEIVLPEKLDEGRVMTKHMLDTTENTGAAHLNAKLAVSETSVSQKANEPDSWKNPYAREKEELKKQKQAAKAQKKKDKKKSIPALLTTDTQLRRESQASNSIKDNVLIHAPLSSSTARATDTNLREGVNGGNEGKETNQSDAVVPLNDPVTPESSKIAAKKKKKQSKKIQEASSSAQTLGGDKDMEYLNSVLATKPNLVNEPNNVDSAEVENSIDEIESSPPSSVDSLVEGYDIVQERLSGRGPFPLIDSVYHSSSQGITSNEFPIIRMVPPKKLVSIETAAKMISMVPSNVQAPNSPASDGLTSLFPATSAQLSYKTVNLDGIEIPGTNSTHGTTETDRSDSNEHSRKYSINSVLSNPPLEAPAATPIDGQSTPIKAQTLPAVPQFDTIEQLLSSSRKFHLCRQSKMLMCMKNSRN